MDSGKYSYFSYLCKKRFRKILFMDNQLVRFKIFINNIIKNISLLLISINGTWYIPSYIKKTNGIILLFDITSQREIGGLKDYIQIINSFQYNYIPVLLVANKINLD